MSTNVCRFYRKRRVKVFDCFYTQHNGLASDKREINEDEDKNVKKLCESDDDDDVNTIVTETEILSESCSNIDD